MVRIILGVLLLLVSQASQAQSLSLIPKVGTLGIGLDVGIPINQNWAVRLNGNGGNLDKVVTESGIDYDASLKARTVGLLLDWHPGGSLLRMSIGAYSNGNTLNAVALPNSSGSFEINGITYPAGAVGSLDAKMEFESMAPYVGIGLGNVSNKGFKFTLDIGALYQRSPIITMNVVCGSALTTPQCNQLQADVLAETAQLTDAVKDYEWLPVIAIGVGWTF
ncbi:MAG: hypothetical protein ACKVP2_05420 [Burkholderiales bacterium]